MDGNLGVEIAIPLADLPIEFQKIMLSRSSDEAPRFVALCAPRLMLKAADLERQWGEPLDVKLTLSSVGEFDLSVVP